MPSLPDVANQRLGYVAPNGKVHVQPVPSLVPLRDPHIGQPLPTKRRLEPAEERRYVFPQLSRVMAAVARVGERSEPIESVCDRIASQLRACPAYSLRRSPLRVGTSASQPSRLRNSETAAGLCRLRVQAQRPVRPKQV